MAGTVFSAADSTTPVSGVTVTITDGDGTVVTRTTNSAGNFYSESSALAPPYTVSVGGQAMAGDATGACNTCHDAGMRIYP